MATRTEVEILAKIAPGVIAHVNEDHVDELLKLARAFGGHAWATDARLERIDLEGLDMALTDGAREARLRVAFDPPLPRANHVRKGIIALIRRAEAILAAPQSAPEAATR